MVSEALEEGMIVLGSRESEFKPQITQINTDETSRVKEISENPRDQWLRQIARGSAEARGK